MFFLHRSDVTLDVSLPDNELKYMAGVLNWSFIKAHLLPQGHFTDHVPEETVITFVPHSSDLSECNYHYQDRFRCSARYLPVPWIDSLETLEPRFPHLSLQFPGKIAYIQSTRHGLEDRQTAIRPGRYLRKFFPDLSDDEVRHWSEKITAGTVQFSLATIQDEIRRAYWGNPMSSCMAKPVDYFHSAPHHPLDVYANSDLAVAYFGDLDNVKARCIVWPAKKIYNRIFGAETLRYLLEQAGYTHGSLSGARVRQIAVGRNHYVCPYIDNADTVEASRDGQWLTIGDDGSLSTSNTCGTTSLVQDDDEDHDQDYWGTCDSCRARIETENETYTMYRVARYASNVRESMTVCESCHSDANQCSQCESHWTTELTSDADDNFWCARCIHNNRDACLVPGCSARWHEVTDFATDTRNENVAERICHDHAEEGWIYCFDCQAPALSLPTDHATDDNHGHHALDLTSHPQLPLEPEESLPPSVPTLRSHFAPF